MTSPRGSAEHGGEHAASLAALAAQAVIGNQLRLPEARCEGGACGARFEDAMALGEGDLRTRAIAAGWQEDLAGLLTCPACQQRAPWPDAFRRGRRAAHAQPAGQHPLPGQPAANGRPAEHGQPAVHGQATANGRPASNMPAAPVPAPAQPTGYEPAASVPAPAQPTGYEPAPAQPAGYAPAPAQQPVNRRGSGRRRADPGPATPPIPAPPPPAGAGAAAWQPPASGWPDPPPDGEVPARGAGFSEWEAWRAG